MPAPSIVSFLTGANPLSDPLSLIFLQILIIVVFARILGLGLRYFKQPQVVAEVISGILLGKSALSSIPAFQTVVFPTASIPNLYLVANIGLTLYLFLVHISHISTAFSLSFHRLDSNSIPRQLSRKSENLPSSP